MKGLKNYLTEARKKREVVSKLKIIKAHVSYEFQVNIINIFNQMIAEPKLCTKENIQEMKQSTQELLSKINKDLDSLEEKPAFYKKLAVKDYASREKLEHKVCLHLRSLRKENIKQAIDMNKNALIVEDHELSATFVELVLNDLGYKITWLRTGKAALQKQRNDFYDIVVCNTDLPGLTGFEVAKQYRVNNKSSLLIIALTIHGGISHDKYREAGFNCLFMKPFNPEEFKQTIQDFTEGRSRT